MRIRTRDGILSALCFAGVLGALVLLDDRVRAALRSLAGGSSAEVASMGGRAGDLAGAMWSALRFQTLEHAPLLVFAVVAAILLLFMLRT